MFLPQVNKHSKRLLFFMVIFMVVQFFINYKRGMVISPFLTYGMFSEVINVKKSYDIFEISQNGKRLRGQDYTPEQWDKIILPLVYFAGINKSNQLYESDIKRLLNKLHLPANQVNFLSTCNYEQFESWYRNYLAGITNQKTESLAVTYRTYMYDGDALEATNNFLPLSQLCR